MRTTVQNRLSAVEVRNAKPTPGKAETTLRDGGGLVLSLRGESRTWVLEYSLGGKRRRMGLGSYPAVTLEQARKAATEARAQLAQRADPLDVREDTERRERQEREAARAAEQARKTVKDIAEDWYRRIISTSYKQPEQVRAMLDKEILPALGDRPVGEVQRTEVSELLSAIVDRGSRVRANRILLTTKQIFGYALDHGYREDDPTARLRRKTVGGTERARDRNLSFDELARLVGVLWSPHFFASPATTGVLRLVTFTGQRVGETVRARWKHIDLNAGEWHIPAEDTKPGRAHLVHLSPQAVEALRVLRPAASKDLTEQMIGERYVFAGTSGEHVTERGVNRVIKNLLHDPDAVPKPGHRKAKPNSVKKERLRERPTLHGMAGFSVHDLRRTMVSRLADMGTAPHVVEKMVNHQMTGVMAVYNRGQYLPERRAAFDLWGGKVAELRDVPTATVAPEPPTPNTNVVAIQSRRRRAA